ncbi:SusF/SusE family outer membrane protein [Prevotella sp. 10(H)]|uniref:SusE domain-containing protein n=1 Tax=Prevotella sp. 10(H) TaxID=1158294 RepID=UPI0004A70D80|nr:SusF/SusE family outer membrane protein [Prevotella sp. 10(H)]
MKIIYKIFPVLAVMLLTNIFVACDDDDDNGTGLGDNPLVIESSASDIILTAEKANETAVTFTWNTGNDRGEGTTLTYNFKMDIADNNFQSSIPKEKMGEGVFTKSYTHEELNDMLLDRWKIKAGEATGMEAKIIADVNNSSIYLKPEVAVVPFTVKTYVTPPKPLYLVGSATTAGMDPAKGVLIDETINGRLYSWKGNLKKGEFKLIQSQDNMLPSFNKGDGEFDIVERVDESEPDNMFPVEKDGLYGMYFSRKDMTFIYKYMPYENVLMVGSCTPAGWTITNSTPMDWSPSAPTLFTYTGWLYAGEIKLPLVKSDGSWEIPYLMPPVNGTTITGEWQEMMYVPEGNPDNKWVIPSDQAGNYILTVDTEAMKIKFEKQ